MSSLALLLIPALLTQPATGAAADRPAPVPQASGAREPSPAPEGKAESIGSLLAEPSRGTGERESGAGGILFRMLGWVAALAVGGLATVRIWKRLAVSGKAGLEGGGIRVVARAALTPKHSLYMVRVANQKLLLVGVSGDRITALTEFGDPAQVLALDPSFQKTLDAAGGEEGRPAGAGGDPSAGEDLSPFKLEARRLLGVVRGWRGRLGRAPGAEVRVRSGD